MNELSETEKARSLLRDTSLTSSQISKALKIPIRWLDRMKSGYWQKPEEKEYAFLLIKYLRHRK